MQNTDVFSHILLKKKSHSVEGKKGGVICKYTDNHLSSLASHWPQWPNEEHPGEARSENIYFHGKALVLSCWH